MSFLEEVYDWLPELKTQYQNLLVACQRISDYLEQYSANETNQKIERIRSLDHLMEIEISNRAGTEFGMKERRQEILEVLRDPQSRSPELKRLTTHALSDILSRHELKHGFDLGTRTGRLWGQAITYLSFIDPDKFREQLTKGRQFKDPTVPQGHGEFTHRIQWYMITTDVEQPAIGWLKFYQWVGTMKHPTDDEVSGPKNWEEFKQWIETRKASVADKQLTGLKGWPELVAWTKEKQPIDGSTKIETTRWPRIELWRWEGSAYVLAHSIEVRKWQTLGLWDALVDRNKWERDYANGPYNTKIDKDFRSPENLHTYFIEEYPEDSILQAFLSGRDTKRLTGALSEDEVTKGIFIARKLYGTTLNQLSKDEAERVAQVIYSEKWYDAKILFPKDIAEKKDRQNQTNGEVWFTDKLTSLKTSSV